MEIKKANNYIFIDFQNLVKSVEMDGWKIDFGVFHKYLVKKHKASKVILFIGYIKENELIYTKLKSFGFEIVFKEIMYVDNKLKGNVDVDLALTVVFTLNDFDKAIIISGDGDFKILLDFLIQKEKLKLVIAPSIRFCSALIKRSVGGRISGMESLKAIVGINEKGPHLDEPQ